MASFGKKLRTLREQEGLSQEALAQQLHVSRSAIAKWENDLGLPDNATQSQIASYFGVGLEDFFLEDKEVEFLESRGESFLDYLRFSYGYWIVSLILLVNFGLSVYGIFRFAKEDSPWPSLLCLPSWWSSFS